ncbi:MAG: TonB-dependent receptor [Pseudomonadota bacterium]
MLKQSLILSAATLMLTGVAAGQVTTEADADTPCLTGNEAGCEDWIMVGTRLQTVTVSGLRPVAVNDVTGSLTVLSGADLDLRSAPFLADELRAVPGVGVSRSGAQGGLTQIRLRGAEANHTLLLIDGIEVSDPTTGESDFGVFAGLRPQSIEVLRGEQSGLYGSDAIGGVINVVTGELPGPLGRVEVGSQSSFRGEAGYGFVFDEGHLNLAATTFSTGGVDTSGLGGEEDGSELSTATASGRVDLSGDWTLAGLVRFSEGELETDPDTDFDGRLNDADRVTESEQLTAGVSLAGEAFGIDHLLRASFNSVERDNFADGALSNRSEGERTKFGYSPSIQAALTDAHITLTGLIEYENEDYSARDTQFGGATDQDQSFETLGLAGDVQADFDALQLSASIRFDDNDGRFDDAVTGRIGAAFTTYAAGRFRASIGTGVKNPTFTELFGFFPGSFVGNPDLVPEESTSWEIGWDGAFGPLDLSAAYFDAQLTDEIFTDFNPDFTATARNREGESERSGVELGARWQATSALSIAGQATFTESSSEDGSDEVRVPSETASLALDYRPADWKGGRIGVAFDYVGEQDDFDFAAFPAARVTLDSYVLASATLEVPMGERLAFTLRGENLFDEDATDVFGFTSPGAGLFVGIKVR